MKAIILGASSIAPIHCRALESLNVDIYGICDKNPDAAERLAKQYSAKVYTDVAQILDEDVDFVSICTPNGTHADFAVQLMNAGKNVVVEKPMSLNTEDCDLILETEKKTGKRCAPISQLRFSSTVLEAQCAFQENSFGKPIMANLSMKHYRAPEYYAGTWKGTKHLDGGELLNQGIHGIDVLCTIAGKPVSVSGRVDTKFHDIEAEDTAVACIEFENGMFAVMESSTTIEDTQIRRLELNGTTGSIVFDDIADKKIRISGRVVSSDAEKTEYYAKDGTTVMDFYLHAENYRDIIKAFETGAPLAYSAKDASGTIKLICGLYESSKTGKRVIFE